IRRRRRRRSSRTASRNCGSSWSRACSSHAARATCFASSARSWIPSGSSGWSRTRGPTSPAVPRRRPRSSSGTRPSSGAGRRLPTSATRPLRAPRQRGGGGWRGRGRRRAVTEDRIEAELALGRHAELVPELEALVAQHPLRERLRAQLMVALYRSGRQAGALRVYHETREVLVEELGLEPGRALQRLERAVLLQDTAVQLRAAGKGA